MVKEFYVLRSKIFTFVEVSDLVNVGRAHGIALLLVE
jgi:hypothetical protein